MRRSTRRPRLCWPASGMASSSLRSLPFLRILPNLLPTWQVVSFEMGFLHGWFSSKMGFLQGCGRDPWPPDRPLPPSGFIAEAWGQRCGKSWRQRRRTSLGCPTAPPRTQRCCPHGWWKALFDEVPGSRHTWLQSLRCKAAHPFMGKT